MTTAATRFRQAYAEHREAEGRRADPETLAALPYLERGPFAREWAVRARTFEAFLRHVITHGARGLNVLDVGAGVGWLCYRLAAAGHRATALDWRWDKVDGLGAAGGYRPHLDRMFDRVAASFDALPFPDRKFDIVVFDAAIHYAEDLARVLSEAGRVAVRGGRIAILDSPFYETAAEGEQMVAEKHRASDRIFGERAAVLLELRTIEYLTPQRLADASTGLVWRKYPVAYPLWYVLRPLVAVLKGQRPPSRFDLWVSVVP